MWKRNFTPWLIVCVLMLSLAVQAQIEVIGEITHTQPEDAARGIPVRIEAQVTHLHPQLNGIYLFDGEYGILVRLPRPAGMVENLKVGSTVKVKGITSAGGFIPDVIAEEIAVVGWSPLPEARLFHDYQLYYPNINLHGKWVKVWGRVVDTKVLKNFDYLLLELEMYGSASSILVPYSKEALSKVEALRFQRVTILCVVGTIYNSHRQMTGRTFLANSLDDFIVFAEEWGDQGEVQPIETLMRAGSNVENTTHTRGLVTYADENSVYLRGDKTCLKVATLGETQLQPGEYVDLLGFVWPQPISPAFRAIEIKVLEERDVPEPRAVDLGNELNPDWCYELIWTEATLVDIGETSGLSRFSNRTGGERIDGGRASLLCRSGERIFKARLPSNMVLGKELKPGAKLRLTGICNLVPNIDPRPAHYTEGVWLELRMDDGVLVIRPSPWWTTRRLLGVIVVVLAIAGLFMVWVILLRKTVTRQTGVIGKQIEHTSILSERQRIARELHDTLEQSLTGMTFQLQSCSKLVDNDLDKGKESLKLAQGMLRHCREESRSSIHELRSGPLENMDLPTALEAAIQPLAEECEAELRITVTGSPRRLKRYAEHHLFRMAKEAVTNAARHASPKHILVELDYKPTSLSLVVTDDGSGFSVDLLQKFERFGLQGMRERANRINAEIKIESVIGQGTTIRVDMLSIGEWEI